jgi:hypothetical protein
MNLLLPQPVLTIHHITDVMSSTMCPGKVKWQHPMLTCWCLLGVSLSLAVWPHARYDGIWDRDSPKCGSYSELQPAAPGSHGAIPCLEVVNAEGVLQAAVTAVAEAQEREAMMQM